MKTRGGGGEARDWAPDEKTVIRVHIFCAAGLWKKRGPLVQKLTEKLEGRLGGGLEQGTKRLKGVLLFIGGH